jgi:hypothetical protein
MNLALNEPSEATVAKATACVPIVSRTPGQVLAPQKPVPKAVTVADCVVGLGTIRSEGAAPAGSAVKSIAIAAAVLAATTRDMRAMWATTMLTNVRSGRPGLSGAHSFDAYLVLPVPPFMTSVAALVLLPMAGSGVALVTVAVLVMVPTLPCT